MADKEEGGGGIGGDFVYFLGIFLLFFFVWVFTGGPSRPLSFQGPYLNPITGPGQTVDAYGNPVSNISTGINVGGWGVQVTGGEQSGGVGITNSIFASSVSLIGDTSGATRNDEDEEYLTVSVSPLAQSSVSTAGWRIVSQKTGRGAPFPQGAESPSSGRVNILAPIVLKPGDSATIVSGRSPVGVSFRENKCTGYFEERQNFHPSLAQNCPTPYQEYTKFYNGNDDECASYIRAIPYCATETNIPSNVSNSCESFVEEYLHYNGCVAFHKDESGFYSSSWRIFLGSTKELWRSDRETILLLDAEGKTIDSLTY